MRDLSSYNSRAETPLRRQQYYLFFNWSIINALVVRLSLAQFLLSRTASRDPMPFLMIS